MNLVEIAQAIAEHVDTKTQAEINAMMDISAITHDLDVGELFRVVGNLYSQINPSVLGQRK